MRRVVSAMRMMQHGDVHIESLGRRRPWVEKYSCSSLCTNVAADSKTSLVSLVSLSSE